MILYNLWANNVMYLLLVHVLNLSDFASRMLCCYFLKWYWPFLVNKDSPRKRLLKANNRRQVRQLRSQNTRLRRKLHQPTTTKGTCILMLTRFFTGRTLRFLSTQVNLAHRCAAARRWSPHDKAIALSVLHASPKAFRILSKLFILPSEITLIKEKHQGFEHISRN